MKRLKIALALSVLTSALAMPSIASGSPLVLNCPGGMSDQTANAALTFGGSGIPKNAVCIGVFGNLTLALTATPRYSDPAVGNDGANTYFAGVGDDAAQGQASYAQWNFGYAAFNSSTSLIYKLTVAWDTDPGAGTDTSDFGFGLQSLGPGQVLQDSWNLGMGFIDTGAAVPGYKPATGLFSPYATGTYGFSLTGVSAGGSGSIAMQVQVNEASVRVSAVPEPASLLLLGTGLVGFAVTIRRRKAKLVK